MAKGFTVKAKNPKPKKATVPEFDYAKAKEMIKGKTVVFCLPGRGVSYTFLKSFVSLCFDLVQSGASIQISQDYSSMVNFARCKCVLVLTFFEDQISYLGMVNLNMIISYGLIVILYSTLRSSIRYY